MRNDQIFVLLLVILLPMSGCFDGAVGDAEGSDDSESGGTSTNTAGYNHPPIISAAITGSLELTEGSDCTTDGVQIEARHAMTDWDGTIAQAGWDTDLDGTIDHVVTDSEGHTMLEIPLNEMTYWNRTSSNYDYVHRQQSVVFGAQDDAGEWTSSELFLIQTTESYATSSSGYNYFDLEPCQDFEDVTQYTFNVTDHPDEASTGNTDYLVEITRTNGQAGIDWSRITIIIGGNNEGDEACSASESTNYRCWIYSGSGLTSTPVGELWEAGETISIKERSNLHNGNEGRLEVKILIDGFYVVDWYDYTS
jgi:hypothetical protein